MMQYVVAPMTGISLVRIVLFDTLATFLTWESAQSANEHAPVLAQQMHYNASRFQHII